MLVLGLESTCDESSAALLEAPKNILANVVKSQIDDFKKFGGVVPEIASRLHLNYLMGTIKEALNKSSKKIEEVDLIAVSHRPGLLGGLLVGTTIAKTLSLLLNKPLVLVDHLYGHLVASDLDNGIKYPCIAGIFSGAHSNIYFGKDKLTWEMMSKSRDDAPGEAFDKVSKLMGLGYPGGPAIQKIAEGKSETEFKIPSPLPKTLEGDFSFSGIKTHLLYQIKGSQAKEACSVEKYPELAASFQKSVAEGLTKRLIECAKQKGTKHIYIGGGVAANQKLRNHLHEQAMKNGIQSEYPPIELCVDNAAMIARAGIILHESGVRSDLNENVYSRSVWGHNCS
jgi:N6-L-threonylcarbamoyladenine synthase